MLRILVIWFVLVLAACSASASKPTPYRLEGIIDSSAYILTGRIMVAKALDEGEPECGQGEIYYSGRIQKVVKGALKKLEFCANQQLLAAGEYLFFFGGAVEGKLLVALPVTVSPLDTNAKWLEINSVSIVTVRQINVRIEKTTDCRESLDRSSCEIIQARELVRLDDVINEIRRRAGTEG